MKTHWLLRASLVACLLCGTMTTGSVCATRSTAKPPPSICSAIGQGTINGLSFSRAYWKEAGTKTGKMFHGLVYAWIASPNIVTITGRDGDPPAAVPMMEASALTLRKL